MRRAGEERQEDKRFATVPDFPEGFTEGERASNAGSIVFTAVLFVLAAGAVLGACVLATGGIGLFAVVAAVVAGLLVAGSVHVANEWEKVVVLRFGRFNRVSGPGLYFTIPVVESNTMRVDTRVRVSTFGAEETLTSDLVPLDVDAVLFWMVFDAKAACTEVADFARAVEVSAQTALRDAIGRGGVAEVALRREQLDRELKGILEEKVGAWGITVMSVEVRDIVLPKDLQESMSAEAKADQQRKARIILMEGEQELAEMMDEVARTYEEDDTALRLRKMHLLAEAVRDTGGTVVLPNELGDAFGGFAKDAE